MAIPMLRLDRQMRRVFQVMGVFLWVMMLAQRNEAYEFTAGGAKGWTVHADSSANALNRWAEKNRYQIGDSLVFVYPPDQDSVLYVNQDDYQNCNDASPIAKYVDGHTVFKFNQSGPFHCISGNKDNCHKNEKMVVVAMADRRGKTSGAVSPSPSGNNGTASQPWLRVIQRNSGTLEINPTPAPVSQRPAPRNGNPTPAPVSQTPAPRNGATSVFVGFTGSIGAFVASTPAPVSQTPAPRNGATSVFVGFTGSIGAFVASSVLLEF